MVAIRLIDLPDTVAAPEHSLGAIALLNYLRFISMSCRSKPQTNLFEACALLHVARSTERDAHADALMRCLNEALGKPAKLFGPATTEVSFDEKWLMQFALASKAQDEASLQFLLNSRVSPENRRLVRFLMVRISEYFYLV